MVMKETPPPAEEAPPLRPLEPKQRITQEELTIEEVRRQPYSVPPPKNEYHYHEEVLPPPDEYHFEEKRTDLLASAPDSMDTRKSRLLVMPWLNVWVPFCLVKRFRQSRESYLNSSLFLSYLDSQNSQQKHVRVKQPRLFAWTTQSVFWKPWDFESNWLFLPYFSGRATIDSLTLIVGSRSFQRTVSLDLSSLIES